MTQTLKFRPLLARMALSAALIVAGTGAYAQQTTQSEPDWRDDWELADGLTMDIDTQGYNLPVQTAFVPNPGSAPRDPLYFVVELKGNIKVVTNDRTVHDYAENFLPNPQGESFVQAGSAGICLDPVNGYVFATFSYVDNDHIYRNGIARFGSEPGSFGLKALETTTFLDLFADELSATSHQIGPCQVKGDELYITVGYGEDRAESQNLHSTLGSIIRMTLDFEPLADNPFYRDDGQDTAVDYIWAYGFRNPFGLRLVGERLFATENGGNIDRFNEIERAGNYLWDGTDWGIGARASQVFAPSIGIVHLDFIPDDSELFPEAYQGRFVAAAGGAPSAKGQGKRGSRSVVMLTYDFEKRHMTEPPVQLLRYRGEGESIPVSIEMGPDALYFVALLPNSTGASPVYKIRYDPEAAYPHRLGKGQSAPALISRYECRQCHKIGKQGGSAGPPLDSTLIPRLTGRLNDPAYERQAAEIDSYEGEPFLGYRDTRRAVLAATGEERVRLWLPAYLREPRFDNPDVEMPNLQITGAHAEILARYLFEITQKKPEEISRLDRIRFGIARLIPELRYRHLAVAFIVGGLFATLSLLALYVLVRRRRRGR